jgi:hypothetical protein
MPVSGDSRRCNGAQWKSLPVERFTGGTGMKRSGNGSSRRSQAPGAADVSSQNLEATLAPSRTITGEFCGDSSAVVLSSIDFASWFYNHLLWNPTTDRGRTPVQNGLRAREWLRRLRFSPVGFSGGELSTVRQCPRLLPQSSRVRLQRSLRKHAGSVTRGNTVCGLHRITSSPSVRCGRK